MYGMYSFCNISVPYHPDTKLFVCIPPSITSHEHSSSAIAISSPEINVTPLMTVHINYV